MPKDTETLQQRLANRTIRRPPAIIYWVLTNLWRLLFKRKYNIHYEYKVLPSDYKNVPYFVVSNHTSRLDYIYAGFAFLPQRLNYLAGYSEFFRSHLAFVLRLIQAIPKRNFTNDIYSFKQISRILNRGGKIIFWPEGMQSISGFNQPCALGSGALLKHFKVPVLIAKIEGGYLTNTIYSQEIRRGRVEVTIDLLFSPMI